MRLTHIGFAMLALGLLSACGAQEDIRLARFDNPENGPEEFSVVPSKPLEQPGNYRTLPAPAPGYANRADLNPVADGAVALGGRPAAAFTGGVPASDRALLRHAQRGGTDPAIRQRLTREDRDARRRYGRVNILRLGPTDDYANAYKRQWLDAHDEAGRLLNAGVPTSSYPPE